MLHDATPSSSESAETARVHQQAWERALELRIALQRGLESANTLPAYPHFTQLSAGDEGASLMLVTELRKLFCSLASTLGDGGDRGSAAVSEEDDVEHMWTSLSTMHNECRQSWEGVIEKWHARLRFGSELSRSKLKVFGQTVFGAIDAALSDETRVLDKSRTPFHESTRMMRQLESSVSVPKRRRGDVDSEDEADETRVDPEVYDDRQTYALLLKSFITSSGSSASGISLLRAAKRNKSTVNRKASKGRRIRYKSHPKLQNFTFPIQGPVSEVDSTNIISSLFR